jgi:hypothetical protein
MPPFFIALVNNSGYINFSTSYSMDDGLALKLTQEEIKKGDMAVAPCRPQEIEPVQ